MKMTQCFFCGSQAESLGDPGHRDYAEADCPQCGRYELSGKTTPGLASDTTLRSNVAYYLGHRLPHESGSVNTETVEWMGLQGVERRQTVLRQFNDRIKLLQRWCRQREGQTVRGWKFTQLSVSPITQDPPKVEFRYHRHVEGGDTSDALGSLSDAFSIDELHTILGETNGLGRLTPGSADADD